VIALSIKFFCFLPIVALLGPNSAAGQTGKVIRIGLLASASSGVYKDRIPAFQQSLRELGYNNVVIESRYADGKSDRLFDLANELLDSNVNVILATSDPSTRAAKKATKTVPIVFVNTGDPVGDGFVASLARPGENATGLTLLFPELSAKRLELFKESFPTRSRLAVIFGAGSIRFMKEQMLAAEAFGISLLTLPLRDPDDVDAAFEKAIKGRIEGLLTNPSPQTGTARGRIIEFARKNRLPGMYPSVEDVMAGGLMSYSPNSLDQYRRAAIYVDKILKGAKPSELPVEQPSKLELVINLKTAIELSLSLPPNVLARADRVIR